MGLPHLTRLERFLVSPRPIGSPWLNGPSAGFHWTPRADRSKHRGSLDVYSRYRASVRPPIAGTDIFETASTVPAGTSLQEIPKDASTRWQAPIPAMKSVPPIVAQEISSSTSEGITIEGIHVPVKPRRPGEEECCMSGCAYCVYDIYAEELEAYNEAVRETRSKLEAKSVPPSDWPQAVRPSETGSGRVAVEEEVVDPSMSAFLALEMKLRKKQAPTGNGAAL
ncbi:oxidoreductase-like protein [Kockovaella imperatae]|uniref:Oxidoreductase-like protein n=1 Tax=Kockovaella imperatae TaxID=4999 RepID=A0A1Y1U982_9TREE|nr:oxidoreductase-like protein [Kockovaella imperatae]ORX34066.1 oxidoreductase-like protein [Kockovaella imperatae]